MINKIVTLCGSAKFKKYFKYINFQLQKRGYLVFMPDSFNTTNFELLNEEQIETLHRIHEAKMMASSIVYFINVDGYMGKDTLRELKFCVDNNLTIGLLYSEFSVDDYLRKEINDVV